MKPRLLLDSKQFDLTLNRLVFEIIENYTDFESLAIIGIKPRGHFLAERIKEKLQKIANKEFSNYGTLDITFYRDDFRRREELLKPQSTDIPFLLENKNVLLIDDVLFTGRTIRSALDALLDFGRPKRVELMVLIDRRLRRDLPIQANYVGKTIDTVTNQRVSVYWQQVHGQDKVTLHHPKNTDE